MTVSVDLAAPAQGSVVSGTTDFTRDVVCIMGLAFDVVGMHEAAQRIRAAAVRRERCMVTTANLNFVVAARSDPDFRHSALHSQLCVADGMPIVWVARLLGLPIRERVSGAGLFDALMREADATALRLYFFGGPPGAARAASECINRQPGGMHCVGYESPGFVSVEAMSGESSLQTIRAARPDFLLVSLGAKKGQAWIERNFHRLEVPVVSHLGAVVNFAAGTLARAPRWMQAAGLEWLWRIHEEPGLWRRYARDALAFARMCAGGVLPLVLQRLSARRSDRAAPGVAFSEAAESVSIRLSGELRRDELEPVRAAFAAASRSGGPIDIELHQVSLIDATAMGLFLLLHGHQRDAGQPLALRGACAALRRQFCRQHTGFLLDEAPRR